MLKREAAPGRELESQEERGAQAPGESGQSESPAPRGGLAQPHTGRERRRHPVRLAGVDRGHEQERRRGHREPARGPPHHQPEPAEAQRQGQRVHAIERRPVGHGGKGQQREPADDRGQPILRESAQDEADEGGRRDDAEPREQAPVPECRPPEPAERAQHQRVDRGVVAHGIRGRGQVRAVEALEAPQASRLIEQRSLSVVHRVRKADDARTIGHEEAGGGDEDQEEDTRGQHGRQRSRVKA